MARANSLIFVQAMSGILRRLATKEWTPAHEKSLDEIVARLSLDFEIKATVRLECEGPASICLSDRWGGPTSIIEVHWDNTSTCKCLALANVLDLYLKRQKQPSGKSRCPSMAKSQDGKDAAIKAVEALS